MFYTNCYSNFTLHTLVHPQTRGLFTLASLADKGLNQMRAEEGLPYLEGNDPASEKFSKGMSSPNA
jgi:hypothetical protein